MANFVLHDAYIFLDNFPFSYVDLLLHVPLFSLQRLSNGSLEPAHEASQVVELQDLLEKQNYELAQMKERMSSLSSRVSEVEQELETARKDLIKSEEMNNKYQRDIKEVTAQKLSTGGSIHTHTHIRMGITVARETSKTASSGLKTASICICSHTLPSSLLLRLFLT